MKKLVPLILIAIIFVQLLAPFSVGRGGKNNPTIKINTAEAADCVITEQNVIFPNGWDDLPPTDPNIPRPATLTMQVTSSGCIGKTVYIVISSFRDGGINTIELETTRYLITTDTFTFTFNTGEKTCSGTSCKTSLMPGSGVWIKLIIQDPSTPTAGNLLMLNKGPLQYLCLGKDASGNTLCNAGTGNFSWGVASSTLSPNEDATTYENKYFYTTRIVQQYSQEVLVTKSKPFNTIELCNADKAKTDNTLALAPVNTTTTTTTTPCELYNPNGGSSGTIVTVTTYNYDITNADGTVTKSATFYDTPTLTALEACNANRDKDITNGVNVTSECTAKTVSQITTASMNKKDLEPSSSLPACSISGAGNGTFMGCIAQAIYYLFFKTTSFLFGLAGRIMDFTLMYSLQDTSYRSTFVVEGWGVVRDFCNMFFIFVMLYIAIGTILNLHSVKTKEMIVNVIIIGLLINFSLFATQIIIDASNILARVFYNPQTIVTGVEQYDASGKAIPTVSELGDLGEIQLSSAIVSKVNPQNLILKSKTIDQIPVRGTMKGEDQVKTPEGISVGTFILVTLLASAVNVVGFLVFLSCAFVFVGRVVMLWLAMILAPLAFFSYTIPALEDTEMIGWKKWWPDTLKMAFSAPIFVFFMYIIIGFMDTGLGIVNADLSNKTVGMTSVIAITVPFIFIMILLMQAKKIAVKMSGEMGAMMSKVGANVGKATLGLGSAVALGVTATAMRGTVGRVGSAIANSDTLKRSEERGGFWGGASKGLRNIGSAAGKGSMDIRGVKIAGKGIADTGMIGVGKPKEGGYMKARADKVEKRQKRAKELEVGEDSPETQAVRNAEHAYHAVKTDRERQDALLGLNNGVAFDQVPAAVTAATANLTAATTARAAIPAAPPAGTTAAEHAEQIRLADIAVKEAQAAVTSANVGDRGIGGLEREISAAEEEVGRAERELKDATDTLKAMAPGTTQHADQESLVERLRINRNAHINGTGLVDLTTGIATGINGINREQRKANLRARQTTIRAQERPVHIAEDNLKRAQNAKIQVNNTIRHEYAETIQGAWSNTINSIFSLGEQTSLAEREAANKILAGVEEAKKITEHH